MVVGGVAIIAVLALFAVFAVITITAESEKPELVGGSFFVPYYDDDPTSGAVGFNVVDGGAVGRLAQVPELIGQERNNQQWVEVHNTPIGTFLVDRSNGNTSLITPGVNTARRDPTRIAPPAAGASATAGASIMAFPTEDGLYLVRRAQNPGGGYNGDVHLITEGSIAGGIEVGASELPGSLATATLVVNDAVVAGDERFAGLGEAGRYDDSLAAVTSGGALWMVLSEGGGGRVVRVSSPSADAIAKFQEASARATADEDVPPPALTISEYGGVGVDSVMTPYPSSDGVAVADPSTGDVTFWGPEGEIARVRVDGLQGADTVLPVNGGALAWFAVGTPGGSWRLVGAGPNGQVRSSDFAAAQGLDIAPPVMVGDSVFSASRRDGTVVGVNVGTGDTITVTDSGRYPLEPELDSAAAPGGGLGANDYRAVTLERHGSRISVNVPAAAKALLLDSDGTVVEVLEKGRAEPIDPNAVTDPNVRGNAEPPPPEEQEQETVGNQPANEEREGDSSLSCEITEGLEPRPPLLLPQSGARASTAVSPRWRYELVSATDCLPSFRVEIRELPNGDPEERDLARPNALNATVTGLKPSTDYEVVVIAFIGDATARSNPARYSTGEAAPDEPTNVRFTDGGNRWQLEWDACVIETQCDEPAVGFEVEWSDGSQAGSGSETVSAAGARRVVVEIDDENVGRNLCFTVVAVGARDTSSSPAPSEAGLCGVRERAPRGTATAFTVSSQQVPGQSFQEILFTPEGLTRQTFPLIMGTRGQVFVDVALPNVPGYESTTTVAWNYSDIPEGGFLTAPSSFTGISATQGSYDYVVTFRNSAGSETTNGSRPLDPISCGPVTVTISGLNFDAGSRTWPVRFTPNNPCPNGVATPALQVTAPSGCSPYPAPLSIQCNTANLNVDSASGQAFGYTIAVPDPPGFRFDGISFSPGAAILQRPNLPAFTGTVYVQSVRRETAQGTTYIVTLRSQNMPTPPSINGCEFIGRTGDLSEFRCSNPEDNQPNIPNEFRYVPGGSLPQGPYPANPGVCGGQSPSGFTQNPSGSVTFPRSCIIALKDLRGPDPSTTLPPDTTCPGPRDLSPYTPAERPDLYRPPNYSVVPIDPGGPCWDEAFDGPPITAANGMLPFGLLGATGLVLYAFGPPGRRRRRTRSA